MGSVLVAYATRYGSTREVAEAVSAALEGAGVPTEVRAAREVDSLEGYTAVVLGGALYFFRWHRDARKFLSRHRRTIGRLPVAVFGLGPINDTNEEYEGSRRHLDKALGKKSWFSPVSVAVFGGRLDPAGLRFPHNNPAMKKLPPSDIRDWDAIRSWAEALPAAFGLRAS
ncbi:MAG: flavodoxin [Thermoleophilia bacterium]|nr:flavodoxin [Thermoleophilia bacterium]